jgi:NDP-sugar pyrophosphorylase family protein
VLEGRVGAPVTLAGEIVEVDGGRAYLGPGASIASEAIGPGAIVLSRAVVESDTRVERSIVWPNETVPAGNHLQDSIYALGRVVNL